MSVGLAGPGLARTHEDSPEHARCAYLVRAGQSGMALRSSPRLSPPRRWPAGSWRVGSAQASGLPPGMKINQHGIIFGAPIAPGDWTAAVTIKLDRGSPAADAAMARCPAKFMIVELPRVQVAKPPVECSSGRRGAQRC
ncbi:MAG: hypothetical protein ACRED8_04965 [Caulobacteraceae bacterium]